MKVTRQHLAFTTHTYINNMT